MVADPQATEARRNERATMRIVAWDARVARTAALATMMGFTMALFLTAATDEGGVAWNERLSRTLPGVPACAGFGAFLALQARRVRGELRALETLGRSPARAGLGAIVGAAIVAGVLSVVVAMRPDFDASAFFPVVRTASALRFENGAFVEDTAGLRVAADGSMQLDKTTTEASDETAAAPSAPSADARRARAQRIAAAATAFLASIALAVVGARGPPRRLDLAAVAAFVAMAIVVFHAVAADRLPILAAVGPTIALIAFAVLRYGGEDAW